MVAITAVADLAVAVVAAWLWAALEAPGLRLPSAQAT
jgi:hypothetical protein